MLNYGSVVVAGILALAFSTWLVTMLFASINEAMVEEDRRAACDSAEESEDDDGRR